MRVPGTARGARCLAEATRNIYALRAFIAFFLGCAAGAAAFLAFIAFIALAIASAGI